LAKLIHYGRDKPGWYPAALSEVAHLDQFYAVLNQVLIFLIIIVIGYIAVKTKFVPESVLPVLSTIFSKIIVPFIVFVNTVNGATRADLAEYSYLIVIFICTFAILITISRITPKLFRIKGNRARLFSLATSFGNVGFVGIPLLLSVFGQRVMIYVTMYALVDQTLFWTYGVTLTHPVGEKLKFSPKTLKNMINPPLIAIILSFILIILNVRLPSIVDRAFTTMSNSGMALPFIYIGGVLATLNLKELLKRYEIYAAIMIKMIIIPICVFLVFRAVGLAPEIIVASSILFGLPTIGMTPMLASANGSDAEFATAVVLMTTLSGLLTLTLVSYVTALI
jgi:predicted permease